MAFMLIWHKSCDCVFVFQVVVHCWRPLTRSLLRTQTRTTHTRVSVCVGRGVHMHVCVCVEQLAIDVYSLPTGEREGAVGKGSALVSLARQRGRRAKGGVDKSQGMM